MTNLQKWFLVLLMGGSLTFSWSIITKSQATHNYQWFKQKSATLREKTIKERKLNEKLKRRIMALRYDHRIIEQTIRDHLSLTREDEIIIVLPQ